MMIRTLLSIAVVGLLTASSSAQVADFRDAIQETNASFFWIESEGGEANPNAAYLPTNSEDAAVVLWNLDSTALPRPMLPSNRQDPSGRVIAFAVGTDLVIASRIRPDQVTLNDDSGSTWEGNVVVRDHTTALALIRVKDGKFRALEVAKQEPQPGTPLVAVTQLNNKARGYDGLMVASEPISDSWQIGMSQAISGSTSARQLGSPLLGTSGTLQGVVVRQGNQTRCLSVRHLHRLISEASKSDATALHRGRIGIQINDTDDGAVVGRVIADTPAEESDLLAGDLVIMVNGEPCQSAKDVMAAVAMARAGDEVTLQFKRDGETFDAPIALATVETGNAVENAASTALKRYFKWQDGELIPVSPDGANPALDLELAVDPKFVPQGVVIGNLSVERSGLEEALKKLEAEKKTQDRVIEQLNKQIAELEEKAKADARRIEERERRRLEEFVEEIKRKLEEGER